MGFPHRIQPAETMVPWSSEELLRKERLDHLREMYAADCDNEAVISSLVQSHLLLRLAETRQDSTMTGAGTLAPIQSFYPIISTEG